MTNYLTGPPPLPPFSQLFQRALGVSFQEVVELSNDPRFLTAIIPAANVVATANDMSRFYQLLLNGGELDGVRVFEPAPCGARPSEQSYLELDLTLGLPFRYGMGFMLGADWFSPYGPYTQHAFGHIGFTNVVCWADPDRRVAAALLTSGKPFLYPGALLPLRRPAADRPGLPADRWLTPATARATRRCPPTLAARVACRYAPRMTIRLASLQGRAQLVHGERLLDLERASGGRFAADPDGGARASGTRCATGVAASPPTASTRPADRTRFDAPVPRPTKVFAIGLNYRSHAEEAGLDIPGLADGVHEVPQLPGRSPCLGADRVGVRRLRGRAGGRDRPACQGDRRRAGARRGGGLLRRPGHLRPQAAVQRQAAAVLPRQVARRLRADRARRWCRSTGCATRTTWRSPATSPASACSTPAPPT